MPWMVLCCCLLSLRCLLVSFVSVFLSAPATQPTRHARRQDGIDQCLKLNQSHCQTKIAVNWTLKKWIDMIWCQPTRSNETSQRTHRYRHTELFFLRSITFCGTGRPPPPVDPSPLAITHGKRVHYSSNNFCWGRNLTCSPTSYEIVVLRLL